MCFIFFRLGIKIELLLALACKRVGVGIFQVAVHQSYQRPLALPLLLSSTLVAETGPSVYSRRHGTGR